MEQKLNINFSKREVKEKGGHLAVLSDVIGSHGGPSQGDLTTMNCSRSSEMHSNMLMCEQTRQELSDLADIPQTTCLSADIVVVDAEGKEARDDCLSDEFPEYYATTQKL